MAIADDIERVRDDCLSSLDASHNYFTHTKIAWRLVDKMVHQGHKVTIHNRATGDSVDETELLGLSQQYVTGYLASATFQNFVSSFERFVCDFLTLWLTEYPGSLSGKQLQFRTVLGAADKNQIVSAVVQKEIHELGYERIADWFAYLEKVAHLGCPTSDQIARLSELKASRDVLVHNNGIVNSIYVEKSGKHARFSEGDLLELPEHYHLESWQLVKQVVSDISTAGIKKLPK